jgi:drug/metabolite transporter (DMT)-like permease
LVKSEHLALLIYVIASTAGVLIIKKFFSTIDYKNDPEFIFHLFNVQLIFGILLYIIGFLTWLYVLSKMDLNIAYPVAITLSFITVLLASTLLLKENFTLNIGIGMVFCLIGVIIILR